MKALSYAPHDGNNAWVIYLEQINRVSNFLSGDEE